MDRLPLYDGSGSPRDWLLENQISLSKYIDVNNCLDLDDKMVCRDFVDSNAIYKNLGVHIYQFLKVHDEWKLRVLKHHMASWMSLDELTCIGSHQAITDFLQSLLEWRETSHLRKIIALDIDALCARLFDIIHSQNRYRALSNLKDHKAQEMLNLMQNLLDCPTLATCFRNTFVGGLLRLSGKSGLVPEALIRQDVTLDMGDAFAAGAFGELHTGTFRGQVVAVKVFKFYQNTDMATYLKAISRETLIWRQLFHPHVLPFICVHYYSTNIHQRIGLVSPWMKHGNVQEFLRQFPDANRTSLIIDVAEGLSYLHSMQPTIIHGDLKAVNVLITDAKTACIGDFGVACARGPGMANFSSWTHSHNSGGTTRWMAPELFNQDEEADVSTNTMTDIYAFGSVCYEIFSGCVPFHKIINDIQIMLPVLNGCRPPRPYFSEPSQRLCKNLGLNNEMWSIIEDCWVAQPEHRPTANEIINRLPRRQRTTSTTDVPYPSHLPTSTPHEDVIAWAISHPDRNYKPDSHYGETHNSDNVGSVGLVTPFMDPEITAHHGAPGTIVTRQAVTYNQIPPPIRHNTWAESRRLGPHHIRDFVLEGVHPNWINEASLVNQGPGLSECAAMSFTEDNGNSRLGRDQSMIPSRILPIIQEIPEDERRPFVYRSQPNTVPYIQIHERPIGGHRLSAYVPSPNVTPLSRTQLHMNGGSTRESGLLEHDLQLRSTSQPEGPMWAGVSPKPFLNPPAYGPSNTAQQSLYEEPEIVGMHSITRGMGRRAHANLEPPIYQPRTTCPVIKSPFNAGPREYEPGLETHSLTKQVVGEEPNTSYVPTVYEPKRARPTIMKVIERRVDTNHTPHLSGSKLKAKGIHLLLKTLITGREHRADMEPSDVGTLIDPDVV